MNTPVILHCHNYYERKSLISSWNKARQFNKFAGIILVIRSLEDAFCADFPLVTVPIHVVYNGIDTNAWQPFEVRKPVIVFAGRAHPTKGAEKVIGRPFGNSPKIYELVSRILCFARIIEPSRVHTNYAIVRTAS